MDYYVPSKIKESSPSFLESLTNFFTDIPLTLQKYWVFLLVGTIIAVVGCTIVTVYLQSLKRRSDEQSKPDQNNMPKL